MAKERLDMLTVQRGLAESREKAQRLIRAGRLRVGGRVESRPGWLVAPDAVLELEQPERFVSRGGEKLEAALTHFNLAVAGRVAMDVGASTGGFTDCLLQHGAARVYAFDVGRGQLHWKLRQDPRVVVREGINVRYLDPADLPETPSLATVDASFISLKLLLPAVHKVLAAGGECVMLIKPQFEAGRDRVGRGGVVRDPQVHAQVVADLRAFAVETLGLTWIGVLPSPLLGPAGNIEFLAYWKKTP